MTVTFDFDLGDWVWIDKSFMKSVDFLRISHLFERGMVLGRIGGLRKIAWEEYLVLVVDGKNQRELWIEPEHLSRAKINFPEEKK